MVQSKLLKIFECQWSLYLIHQSIINRYFSGISKVIDECFIGLGFTEEFRLYFELDLMSFHIVSQELIVQFEDVINF